MLQIATGRLFARDVGRTNQLRGTIYTNATFPYGMLEVEVTNGRLLPPSTTRPGVKAVAYDFTERIELEADGTQGVIVSSSAVPYTLDFATLVSFALNCVASPDYTLVQRLIGGQPGVSTGLPASRFIKRAYDADLFVLPRQVQFLQTFVQQLIGLPRVKFLGAMRAIRTYVTALHRVADDLELAYTLLVASVESLAQDFDGHQADWDSLEDRKRHAIDEALDGAPEDVAQRVRTAMLSIEHVALSRRYREFTLSRTKPSFFRSETAGVEQPAARADIEECLRQAYTLRSKYVHSLQKLPHMLITGHIPGEVVVDGRTTYFTVSGLARLMRHVIINFVMEQQPLPHEVYDYHLERHGVGAYQLDPQYWVGAVDGDITGMGRDKLGGFLQQLTAALMGIPGATITDLRPVLTEANQFIPGITRDLRRPYLALMALFNWYAPANARIEPTARVAQLMAQELGEPSSEALLAHCLTDHVPGWPLPRHREALDGYFRRRTRKGIRAPRLIEAAMVLDLAERYRAAGDIDQFRQLVALAVETAPGSERLSNFEANLQEEQAVVWRDLLLPPPEPPAQGAAA